MTINSLKRMLKHLWVSPSGNCEDDTNSSYENHCDHFGGREDCYDSSSQFDTEGINECHNCCGMVSWFWCYNGILFQHPEMRTLY